MGALKDLLMEGVRDPRGVPGDDAHGDSIVEAARHVLEECVRPASRGGSARLFSESPTSSYVYVKGSRASWARGANSSPELQANGIGCTWNSAIRGRGCRI